MRGAVFLLMFLAMLPAAFAAAPAALMLWVWTSLAAPQAYVFGALADLPYSKIVVAVALMALLIDKTRKPLYADMFFVLLTLFMMQAAVSFAFSITTIERSYELPDRLWKIYLLCLFAASILRGRLQMHSLIIIICLGTGIHGVIEAAKFLVSGGGHIVIAPPTYGDNNSLGLFMLMTVPLLSYLRRYSIEPIVRLGTIGGILLNLIGIIATGSRGAFVGLIAVTLAMIQQSKRRVALFVTVLVFGAILAYIAPSRLYERVETIKSAEADGSFMSRVMSWKMNTLVALDRPLLGGGFSAMEDPRVFLQYIDRFDSLSFVPTDTPVGTRAAHSIFFQVLGDMGFFGFFLFLAILVTTFWNLFGIRKATRGKPELQWAFDLAGYVRLALIAYVVSGAALSVAYFELPFVLFTLASVLRRTVRDELTSTQPLMSRVAQARTRVGATPIGRGPASVGPRPAGRA
jgi:putative inorganic carbon (HCO3(-)) transporter